MTSGSHTAAVLPRLFHSKGLRTFKWCLFKAALPGVVLLLIYPVYRYVIMTPVNDAFGQAFSHGDFLLMALLLLIETALDGENLFHAKTWVEALRMVAFLGGLVFTVLFAVNKFDMLVVLPKATASVQHERLEFYAWANCLCVVFAVIVSMIEYYALCAIEEETSVHRAKTNA